MQTLEANKLARDVAQYIRNRPKPIDLRIRVQHITHGEHLDQNDVEQIVRKVRRLLFGHTVLVGDGVRTDRDRHRTG